MTIIYHYCSPEVFDLVIRNRTIRLSDLDKTNDYMEKEWGSRLIEKVLVEELKKRRIAIDLKKSYWYSDDCLCHLEYLMQSFLYYRKKQTLIACLSLEGDDLGQWRGYGLAIGFDYGKMSRLLKFNGNVEIKNVIYKREKQEKELAEYAIIPALNYIQELFDSYTFRKTDDYNTYFEDEFDTFTEVVVEHLARVVSYIKNPAFEAEKEVRLIHHTDIGNCMEEADDIIKTCSKEIVIGRKKQFVLQPVSFQFKNNKLVSYADLSFANMVQNGIIKEVVIGPKSDIREEDLYYYMIVNGYGTDVNIRKSDASYR